MLQAQNFVRQFRLITTNSRGFKNPVLLDGFIERVRHAAVRVDYPLGQDSYDASERYYFSDGSSLTVDNPNQASFPTHISAWVDGEYVFA